MTRWADIDFSAVPSPSLLIDRPLLERNIRTTIGLARDPSRVRPHAKTHKMIEVARLEAGLGITKHKCATIAEAEMLGRAGAEDVLIAYPLVGPNLARFARLVREYPGTTFRATVDAPESARALASAAKGLDRRVPTLVDLDVGMGRTGIAPGEMAEALYGLIASLPGLAPDGLHAYDGHVREADLDARRAVVRGVQEATFGLRDRLVRSGLPVPRIVFGGTPSFPLHAAIEEPGVECSPGTMVLHDHNYASRFPDLPFTPAAFLLTRVVSRPGAGRLCLDLGHKAVAADPPAGARCHLIDVPEPTFVGQSEEHLVVETPAAGRYPVGSCILAIPAHVCPTVALHRRAYVVEDGRIVDEWEVAARDRVIGI
ncbi:D-threonine aldolase [Aquisphaera giovannonii]|uniref:D-threonine aldolase n=1 Tax=Aquisphaera giovannonii TaxID=406548 RepID=A0A5B9WCK8_9BACT|nr:D-TA family PLP-dependent enzyme [Aquisphaera giovannonii]QEH38257.1 D-threonine aldolase [Aquisphaera giovannonii]